ncbi:hypothetical protein Tco_0485317 [Tanacetum coccineum]
MHNNIMAAGSKERPPMLGPGRYSQWHSRFLRYLDTKSNVAAHGRSRDIHHMTAREQTYFQAEKDAMFMILNGSGDEILLNLNVQFLQQLQPEWSRFVTVVKQRQEIDTVSYHKLFDVLKQFQNEVNDIRSERLARSGNPLALLLRV